MKSTLAGPTASCLFLLALIATSIVADAFPIRQIDTLLFTRHAGSATVTHSYGYPNPAPANAGPAVTSAADLASGNAFADGAADDNSPTCAAARAQISRWANVTECFGPVTQLFFATPEQVCAGKCLEVTVQASAIITKACAQSVPKEGNFGRSGVYKVWSDPVGAQSACAVLAKSTDYDTFPFEVSPDEDGPLTEFKIAGAKASVGVKASVGSGGGEATASMPYTIEAVFDLYMQWKAAKSGLPDHTQLLPEATRKTLAASQCTRFNRDFWSAFISKPGGQPTLYYWSILEPQDYVKDLESICGPGYLTPPAATQAAAAAASTTTPCDESKITSSAAVPTH